MKFLHLSDLHLGRSLHRFSLQEEQAQMLDQLIAVIRQEMPDAVLIAGDVYDKGIPPIYATQLLDGFLAALSQFTQVCLISGNHDQAERLAFLSGPLEHCGIHVSPAYRGEVRPVTLQDENGAVDVWLLPFVKAATVRPYFPDETIETTHDAVACALRHMSVDLTRRNILVAHQFVAGSSLSGSEESLATADVSVGGSDMVGADLFGAFDYVALGHIHRAQNVGSERIRYCGTPMAYDFSETGMEKSVTVVELDGTHALHVRTIPLTPLRALVEIRGSFDEVTGESALRAADRDAYTRVILTDNEIIPDVLNRLRQVYPRIARLDWDNLRMQHLTDLTVTIGEEKRTPHALFSDFFRHMGGGELSAEQINYLDQLIQDIWGGDTCDR